MGESVGLASAPGVLVVFRSKWLLAACIPIDRAPK